MCSLQSKTEGCSHCACKHEGSGKLLEPPPEPAPATDTDPDTKGWLGQMPEEDWMARLYELYVRRVPRPLAPECAALKQYRAGQKLHLVGTMHPKRAAYPYPTVLQGCAVSMRCPPWQDCNWCNCLASPCTCQGNIEPPKKVPKGLSRFGSLGGPRFLQRLLAAATESCSCPLASPGHFFCPADRLDFYCYKTFIGRYEDRRLYRILMDARRRDFGTFQEGFEYQISGNRRSVSTQTYMEIGPDGKDVFWRGPGKVRMGIAQGLWSAKRNIERGASTSRPLSAPAERLVLPAANESGLSLYDVRGVQFSVHQLPTHTHTTCHCKKKGWLHKAFDHLKWDGLVTPSKMFTWLTSQHSKPPFQPEPEWYRGKI